MERAFRRAELGNAICPQVGGDQATINIWAPGADPLVDAPVLTVDGDLDHGNTQAHYDQPPK